MVFATPLSSAMICCVRSAMRDRFLGGQRVRLVERVGVERLRAAEHRGERLQRDAHHVVVGLLRGERHAGGLRVRAELHALGLLRAEALLHEPRPDAARRAELGDLLEEVVVDVEEEAEARRELVDVEAALEARSPRRRGRRRA